MKKLVLLFLLVATLLPAQSRIGGYDGRNWVMLTTNEKTMLVLGVFLGNYFVRQMNYLAAQEGVIAEFYADLFENLNPPTTVGDVREKIDAFYEDWGNRPIPLWRAFYLAQGLKLWD